MLPRFHKSQRYGSIDQYGLQKLYRSISSTYHVPLLVTVVTPPLCQHSHTIISPSAMICSLSAAETSRQLASLLKSAQTEMIFSTFVGSPVSPGLAATIELPAEIL